MKLKVHPLYILLGGIYIVLGQGYIFICYFVAVVLHEIGHAMLAKKLGMVGEEITLYPFGGEVKISGINLSVYDEIKIALAGPLVNLLVASLILSLNWLYPSCYTYTHFFYTANLFNAVLNLIPIFPLDGGRVACSLLRLKLKKGHAMKVAMISGYVFSGLLMVFGIYMLFKGNFSYIILASFLLVSQIEMYFQGFLGLPAGNGKKAQLHRGGLAVKQVLVHEDTLLYKLLSQSSKEGFYVFHIVDSNFTIKKTLTEKQILQLCTKNDIYAPIKNSI